MPQPLYVLGVILW